MPARNINYQSVTEVTFDAHPSLTPTRAHDDDAGWDLRAAEGAILPPGKHVVGDCLVNGGCGLA